MKEVTIEVAKRYLALGLAVLPASKAEKRPLVGAWKTYRKRPPTTAELESWFAQIPDALCLVTGGVSGNLECIDFDHHAELYDRWKSRLDPAVLNSLVIERTQSSGIHAFYRCEEAVEGNMKLARGIRDGKSATLIETRGEGGIVLCAPSAGYALIQGCFDNLPVLSPDARQGLLEAARALDETAHAPVIPSAPAGVFAPSASDYDLLPGKDFDARGDIRPILTEQGWQFMGKMPDGNEHWTRPGKNGGTSATFNGTVFYVFSSNAEPFEANRGYSPFSVYVQLVHGGDAKRAASALLDLGFGKKKDLAVDMSALLASRVTVEASDTDSEAPEDLYPNPGPLRSELMVVPGFVGELKDYTLATSPRPNEVAAFNGALAMMSFLGGRKYTDSYNSRTNNYFITLGPSTSGKDNPRDVNRNLLYELGMSAQSAEAFASGQGLEDALAVTPSMLFQPDEVDSVFRNLRKDESVFNTMGATLLTLYTSSKGVLTKRKTATQTRRVPISGPSVIVHPSLVLLGSSTPDAFYGALAEHTLTGGLAGRCFILECTETAGLQQPKLLPIPERLKQQGTYLREFQPGGNMFELADALPQPYVIPEKEGVTDMLWGIAQDAEAQRTFFDRKKNEIGTALWGRAYEKVRKLAMVYALSENPYQPQLSKEGATWAYEIVSWSVRRLLHKASLFMFSTGFEEIAVRIRRALATAGGTLQRRDALRASRVDSATFGKVMDTMLETGEVIQEVRSSATKSATVYRSAARKPSRRRS